MSSLVNIVNGPQQDAVSDHKLFRILNQYAFVEFYSIITIMSSTDDRFVFAFAFMSIFSSNSNRALVNPLKSNNASKKESPFFILILDKNCYIKSITKEFVAIKKLVLVQFSSVRKFHLQKFEMWCQKYREKLVFIYNFWDFPIEVELLAQSNELVNIQ